ncbi:MAG: aminoacyl-tRNA hydrolase, partial [Planctomycetales bacterium]|nr:aminoacyl-tRNA hydrolase [Planctomycetales bacterium]
AVETSPSLPEAVRQRFIEQNGRRMNRLGQVVIISQRFRDQGRNTADCLARLRDLLLTALVAPKQRKKTRPTLGSKRRRLEEKKTRSTTKQLRRAPRHDD